MTDDMRTIKMYAGMVVSHQNINTVPSLGCSGSILMHFFFLGTVVSWDWEVSQSQSFCPHSMHWHLMLIPARIPQPSVVPLSAQSFLLFWPCYGNGLISSFKNRNDSLTNMNRGEDNSAAKTIEEGP
jgi:hypothetical protein